VGVSRLSDAFLFLTRSKKNTDYFTVWLYFHDEQLSQTRYDKLSKSRQQINKNEKARKEQNERKTSPRRLQWLI
jgi:hypothetical protein